MQLIIIINTNTESFVLSRICKSNDKSGYSIRVSGKQNNFGFCANYSYK